MTILQNKIALISGGARRVGAAVARELHACGMNLFIHYQNSETAAQELQAELCAARAESVSIYKGDLTSPDSPKNIIAACVKKFGAVDALINNAAAFYKTPFGEVNLKDWHKLINTNLTAPFFLSQECAPFLKKTKGAIINITDLYAHKPRRDFAAYCISKSALQAMTTVLAAELAPQVRVHSVAPGAILWAEGDTDKATQKQIVAATPLKSHGDIRHIAAAVKYLLADAEFSTAQVLHIDGGRMLDVY